MKLYVSQKRYYNLFSFWNKRVWEPGGVLTDHMWRLCFSVGLKIRAFYVNQRVQVVQQRPHKIRTNKDKNNDVLFSRDNNYFSWSWSFLECSEKFLSNEKYKGLCRYLNVQRKLASSEMFSEVHMVKRTKVVHEKTATHQLTVGMMLKEGEPTSLTLVTKVSVDWKVHPPDQSTWNIESSLKSIQLSILEDKYDLKEGVL